MNDTYEKIVENKEKCPPQYSWWVLTDNMDPTIPAHYKKAWGEPTCVSHQVICAIYARENRGLPVIDFYLMREMVLALNSKKERPKIKLKGVCCGPDC